MEADGCMIPPQLEERKKHELKVGISYEGWSRAGEDKWRTKTGGPASPQPTQAPSSPA